MEFDFSEEKNQLLLRERGVTFQDVIAAVLHKGVLADLPHPNVDCYPNQRIIVVELDSYTYCVPYVTDGATNDHLEEDSSAGSGRAGLTGRAGAA